MSREYTVVGTYVSEGGNRDFMAIGSYVSGAAPTIAGALKVWNGSTWLSKPTKVWNGSAWVTKPAKMWNGSAWVWW